MDSKHNRPLLLQKRRHRLTKENPRKETFARERYLVEKRKAKERVKKSLKELVQIRRVTIGTIPYVKSTSLKGDAHSATNVCSDTLRQPSKKSKKNDRTVASLKESIHFGLCCVSQDYLL